jgi:hypothetical protein
MVPGVSGSRLRGSELPFGIGGRFPSKRTSVFTGLAFSDHYAFQRHESQRKDSRRTAFIFGGRQEE